MSVYATEDDQLTVRYAARQPVLTSDQNVVGYELLFRSGVKNYFSSSDSDGGSRTAIDVSSLLGLSVLCDNRLAFIHCTAEILEERFLTLLPPTKVVAEIAQTVPADEPIKKACQELKQAGFKIALSNFTVDDPRESLVALADYVKVDIKRTSVDDLRRLAVWHRMHNGVGPKLLAEKVETWEDFEYTKRAGFQLFQGYFFRRPETVRTRVALSSRVIYLQLLHTVSKPDLDWQEVEDLIKKDATLYYRLLRYLNSAGFGFRGEIRSVNQALMILGENELRRWCRLAGAFEMSKRRPSDLVLTALVRARFGELMEDKIEHGPADLFLLGLLSLMDAILEMPMQTVIEGLPLDDESRILLVDNQGPLLPLYEMIWSIERGAWRSVVRICSRLGIEEEHVAASYSKAMEWAHSMATGV